MIRILQKIKPMKKNFKYYSNILILSDMNKKYLLDAFGRYVKIVIHTIYYILF